MPPTTHPHERRLPAVTIKGGREKSLARRHPWVFSGAVSRVDGNPAPGDTVAVCGADGVVYGMGAFSPRSKIRVRMWHFHPEQGVDAAFFRHRLGEALRLRGGTFPDSGRMVNAEGDGLPGIVVDRYASHLVCQFLTAGAQRWKETLTAVLAETVPCQGIYERSGGEGVDREGIEACAGTLYGVPPPERIEIREGDCRFLVDVRYGHKTGFYFDQRENRRRVAGYANGAEVLNGFSYTGGFAVTALRAGARRVVNIDTSADALQLASENVVRNGLDPATVENIEGDVFQVLRRFRDEGRLFDMVILDPPKFAGSRKHLQKAARGYKDINLLGVKLLRAGGVLATFSCSGLVDRELFQRTVAWAAGDAGREVRILEWLSQAPDHPVSLAFPEGTYLKGLLCRVG